MSSTSIYSSSFEYSSLLDDSYGGRLVTPALPGYCPALTQPLVYYAEIQPKGKPPSKERKPKRNCFVRAFKWYSHERQSKLQKRKGSMEPCGFASWLDTKYSEYVQESEVEPLQQPPSINEQVCPPCRKVRRKRFSGLRPLWGKRSGQSVTADDAQKTPQESCQFVLQPKDLTRPQSECCHAIPIPIKKTTTPTEIKCSRMTFVKSRSATSINNENAVKQLHVNKEEHTNQIYEDTNASHVKCLKQDTQMSIANTPCDPSCRYPEAFFGTEIRKALEKLQTTEPLCDPSCAGTPQYKSEGEKQEGSAKINIKDILCEPNKVNCQQHQVGLEIEKVSTKTLASVCSPSTRCQPDYKSIRKALSPSIKLTHKADMKSHKKAHEKRRSQSAEAVSSSSRTDLAKQRNAFKKTHKMDTPVICSCTNIKRTEAETVVDPAKGRKIEHFSKSKSKQKSVKTNKMELPCDSNCAYYSELLQQIGILPSAERTPTLLPQMSIPCDSNCKYFPKCKSYDETQIDATKTQKISGPREVISCAPQTTSLDTNTTAKSIKMEAPCDTTYKTQPETVQEIQCYREKSKQMENSCDPNCTYLSKQQTMDIPCSSSCCSVAEFKTSQIKRAVPEKKIPQLDVVSAHSCTHKPEYKNCVAIQKETLKQQTNPINTSHDEIKRPDKMEYMNSFNPCYELHQPLPTQQTYPAQNYTTNRHSELMDEIVPTAKPLISCECHVATNNEPPTTSKLMKKKQDTCACLAWGANPQIDNCCDFCFVESSKTSIRKVSSTQKINQSSQYPEYQTVSIKVDDQFESQLHALDPANTTSNKYVLIPESRVIGFNRQSQCDVSTQHLSPTNIPFQLIVFEKIVVPEQTQPLQYPDQLNNNVAKRSSLTKKTQATDVSCQYSSQDVVVKVDSISQYEQTNFSYYYDPACLCGRAQAEKSRLVINEQRTNSYTTKNVLPARKPSCSLATHRSNGMQTSDHSIRLEDDTGTDYAFFMKIVCADKLNDCCCDKSID